ncbi:thermonuclease family protein [Rhodovibrio sodomensis]|nr:thermonuclease family protein [Rhodovibrio sodomensis]
MTFRTLFAAALVAFSASMASAQEVYRGDAEVIDGDTLEVSGERIRLHGIDAPESDQPCYHKGEARMCGRNATQAVRSYLRGKQVACRAHDRDRYGRVIATCYVFENGSMRDLNAAIVESGFAFAYRRYSREYVEEEDVARSKRRGVWKGRTLYPWEYRRGERLAQ